MNILVNGKAHDVRSHLLSDVLDELGYGDAKIATAVNGNVVPAKARPGTPLQSDDRLEILAPMQGG